MRLLGDLTFSGLGQARSLRIEQLTSDPVSPSVGQFWYNTTEGAYKGYDGTTINSFPTVAGVLMIADEVSTVEIAAGLNSDGTYTAPANTTYLGTAGSLKNADVLLDTALKAVSDSLGAETNRAQGAEATLTTNLGAEVARAESAEASLALGLANEVIRAEAAETTLTTNLANEVTRAQGAEATLTTNLANEVTRAQGAETGLNTRLSAVESSYVNKDGTVAYAADQSMNGHALTNVATPVADGDATNKGYVDTKVSNLGNVFSYVGVIAGGTDAASAIDMAAQIKTAAGDYYKVSTSGYFKVGAAAAFFVNARDGIVFNTTGGVDIIDNTDSEVQGSTNFISVTGTTDAGFVVDVDANFKTRVSTLESDLVAEIARAEGAETTLTTNLANEVTRAQGAEATLTTNLANEVTRAEAAETTLTTNLANEVTRAQAAEASLSADLVAETNRANTADAAILVEIDAIETAVGLAADGTFVPVTGSNYLGAATSVVGLATTLDTVVKALNTRVDAGSYLYEGSVASTTHVVSHHLGNKYNAVTVYDSTDRIILPDNIVADSVNQLTISFASAITCKAVVSGVKAA